MDVVSDGEQGKISYSTYVAHCLTWFEGKHSSFPGVGWPATRGSTT
jgi:hypothetical protein